MIPTAVIIAALAAAPAYAAVAQSFVPPSSGPTQQSSTYTGKSNSTLPKAPVVAGKSFDRFISIVLENTDYATSASSPVFQNLSSQVHSDAFYAFPKNVSTIADLLDAKNISWASYQENMPYDGFTGFNYTQPNYLNKTAGDYTYYVRKHSPLILSDSVSGNPERALRHRNFNDFAADMQADALPQWVYITPNLVNDGHDTTIDFQSQWLEYFLYPLLADERFNNNRTLILVTYDENETYEENNQVYTIVLGKGIPKELIGTTDNTYYTHYSSLSTVEANWGLGSLGRGDTNKTLANVYSWVANATGYQNNGLTNSSSNLPLTNLTGVFPGFANDQMWTPILAPNMSAVGAGGGPVFAGNGTDTSLTSWDQPINWTARGEPNPGHTDPGYDYSSGSLVIKPSASSSSSAAGSSATGSVGQGGNAQGSSVQAKSGAASVMVPLAGALAAVAGVVALL
ncbi:acid phosphatase [Rhodotorula toruloides]|uniref:Acid phosphatase n=1 Tax=Rhodotorula toruloides TaxID=5286 RepID=A0A511KNP7_RHOTO|nr:acid phosphatase [Rhodotorula toruloides]